LNVQEQVHNVWKIPYVQEAWKDGRRKIYLYIEATWVHGWVYHVETGLIEDVMLETTLPNEMRQAFELTFKGKN
jgi:carbonic anhydrase